MTITDTPRTGTRRQLLADLHVAGEVPRTLVLIAVRRHDMIDPSWMVDADERAVRGFSSTVRAVARAHDARSYRLDRLMFAVVGPPELDPGSVVMGIRSPVVHGAASLPDDGTGAGALRVALDRLRARARRHAHSAERQVRDVLLSVLAERRGDRDAAAPRVAERAVGTGRRLGLGFEALDELVRAAELQDLGKLLLPDAILHKRSTPSPDEWDAIRRHPLVAERIVAAAPGLGPVARLVRSCSERFDGSGYPDGLAGDRIALGARIIAVCVAYDAMTTQRPYRPALSADAAVAELCRCAGHQFDPVVVAAFCALLAAGR